MNPADMYYLPSLHQKIAVLALAIVAAIWLVNMVRKRHLKEEHALIWFLGLAGGVALVWVDRLLAAVTVLIGATVPASALLLATLFFLFIAVVRLTSEVSRQKEQIARLVIHTSVLRDRARELEQR